MRNQSSQRSITLFLGITFLLAFFVPTTVTAQTFPEIALNAAVPGRFAPGDEALEDLVAGNDGDDSYADAFRVYAPGEQALRVAVTGSVPIYVALLDETGTLAAGAGHQGDTQTPTLESDVLPGGYYTVVVNSYYGDPGTYTVVATAVSTDSLAPIVSYRPGDVEIVELPTPVILSLNEVQTGTFAEGDTPLEAVVPGNAGDTSYTDVFSTTLVAGEPVTIQAQGDVPLYLAVLTSDQTLLLGDGIHGDESNVQVTHVPGTTDSYILIVNSYYGEVGTYTLSVRAAESSELEELASDLPVDGVISSGDSISDEIELSDRIYRTYVVDVTEGATSLTIAAQSTYDIDLFVRYGMQILNSYSTEADYTSNGTTGAELVRVNAMSTPPLIAGRYYIDVAALVPVADRDNHEDIPFTISAQIARAEIPIVIDVAPAQDGTLVTGMFAGSLTDGQQISARIDPIEGFVQVWTIDVPVGTRRLDVATYNATGRLDMVATPPGMNLPGLDAMLAVPYQAFTARDNEHLVIDVTSNPPISPGTYTVAVLELFSDVASDYEIAVAVDRALDPQTTFVPATSDELADLNPLQRAIRSTVQLTLTAEEGSLAFGSGSILTPDGIILTNHHVLGDCIDASPHLLGCLGDVYRHPDGTPLDVVVGVSNESQSSAEQQFVAHVIRSLPDFDLALIQIDTDLDGQPVDYDLPLMPIAGDLNDVRLGDSVSVIGYPAIAGLGSRISLSMTRGYVTGFTDDRGQRVLINIDANIGGGNSGGAMVNEDGVLVGVPSNQNVDHERGERQDFARALNLIPDEWLELLEEHGADIR